MNTEVIKSFLVSLGFGIDGSSFATFSKAIASATLRVAALYTSIQVAAVGIFKGVAGIADSFEKLGYETRILAPAISKAYELRKAMFEAYSRAGIDITKVVHQSVAFNLSLEKTKFAFDAIYKSVGSKFIPVLTKQMDVFRSKLYANLPKIQSSLEKVVKFLLKAFEATAILGGRVWSILGRVWDFFVKLDQVTEGWSTKILLAVAAWKLLNLSFLASPLGLILTGLLAILALFDDFKTWQEGGKSFFNWSKAVPVINEIKAIITSLATIVGDLFNSFRKLFSADFSGFFNSLSKYLSDVIGLFGHVIGLVDKFAGAAASVFSGGNKAPAAQEGGGVVGKALGGLASVFGGSGAAPALTGATQPMPNIGRTAMTSQHVTQETNINVQGSADANSTARAVSGEQGKVNFDMTRNLRGATR